MKAIVTAILCISVLLLVVACSVTSTALAENDTKTNGAAVIQSDADAIVLEALADRVVILAREIFGDAVLKQLEVNTKDGR